MNLNDIIDEILSVEREEIKTPTIRERFANFRRRSEIEKAMKDERDADDARVIELGSLSEHFIKSRFYGELIEPFVKGHVKSSLQRLIRDGETLSESQLKSEIAGIRKCLALVGSLKLKIAQAKDVSHARQG